MHKPDRKEGDTLKSDVSPLLTRGLVHKDRITLNLKRNRPNPEKTNLYPVFGIKPLVFRSFKYQVGMLADAFTYH